MLILNDIRIKIIISREWAYRKRTFNLKEKVTANLFLNSKWVNNK